MILLFKIFICALSFFNFSYAHQWPCVVVSHAQKNFLTPSRKHVVVSRAKLKKQRICNGVQHVFVHKSFENVFDGAGDTLDTVFVLAQKKRSTKVRVLLAQVHHKESVQWRIKSAQGFLAYLGEDDDLQKKIIKSGDLVIKIKHGIVTCNGKRVTDTLRLKPLSGHGECNGIAYDGDFIILAHKDNFLCINQLDLEDYICSVLRTESWPGWPLEVNKVFAIACRSYVMFKILETRRSKRPFHVKDTNVHQTYRGKHEVQLLKTAVKQTKGMVLGFEGEPILAMFDSCCGGIIPAHIADFDFDKAPYLARSYACHHCKESSLYSWQVSYDQAFFEAQLQNYYQSNMKLFDIHVTKKDKAGLVSEVKMRGPKTTTIIPGKKLYSLLKEIKSFHFEVGKKAGKIVFTGRGFGHHIGLCQWGARQMVRDGWDYKSILRFYYPGAYLMHLM